MRALVMVAAILVMPALAHAEIVAKGVRADSGIGLVSADGAGDAMSTSLKMAGLRFAGGTFIRNRFTSSFSMQFELDITLKGLSEESCGGTTGCMPTADVALWYLELPVLLRFDLIPGDGTRFHLDVGPELVVALGGTRRPVSGADETIDLVPGNLGIMVGTGLDFRAGAGHILFDIRYSRWLAPLISDGPGNEATVRASHQLSVAVGYAFP